MYHSPPSRLDARGVARLPRAERDERIRQIRRDLRMAAALARHARTPVERDDAARQAERLRQQLLWIEVETPAPEAAR